MMALAGAGGAQAQAIALPADVNDRVAVERYMRACETEWALVGVHGNPNRMRDCLADDYQGVTSRNRVVSKTDATAINATASEFVSFPIDYVNYRHVAPNVIVAQGAETGTRKDGTSRTLVWHDIWLLRNGRWQIVASQDNAAADTGK
jgi:hypothetical protein